MNIHSEEENIAQIRLIWLKMVIEVVFKETFFAKIFEKSLPWLDLNPGLGVGTDLKYTNIFFLSLPFRNCLVRRRK